MRRKDWPVSTGGIRPAGRPSHCFYCGEEIGIQHRDKCVVRSRTVVVRATVEYTIEVPEDWDEGMIEFHRNESSLCSGNQLVQDLIRIRAEGEDRQARNCLCGQTEWSYVREATTEDEARDGVAVAAIQS